MKPFSKEPCTSKVLRVLVNADDFLRCVQIRNRLPEEPKDRISAAISHLYRYKAIDFLESDGSLWWFATKDQDTRSKIHSQTGEGTSRPRRPGYKKGKRHPRDSWK